MHDDSGDSLDTSHAAKDGSTDDPPGRPAPPPWGDRYRITRDGRVLSKRKDWKELKQTPHPKGYRMVSLYGNGRGQPTLVHRLVAAVYLPLDGAKEDHHVHHVNGDPTDNRAANLEWIEPSIHGRQSVQKRSDR